MKNKILLALLLAASAGISAPAAASSSAYDLLIFTCDRTACMSTAEQMLPAGIANMVEYNRNGLRLLIETLARRSDEEDARISINMNPTDDGGARPMPASFAQRVEALVVKCRLTQAAFSPLTTFVRDGKTYQIWARLAQAR